MKVLTSDGFIEEFSKNKITESLKKDITFWEQLNSNVEPVNNDQITKISDSVTRIIRKINGDSDEVIASDTIRGLTVTELVKRGYEDLARIVEVVGLRTKDIYSIVAGSEDSDNANLQPSPETSHKLIADKISKKYLERVLPKDIVTAHISGDLHIHDAEYFASRPFCRSWDLRPFLYYGFSPDNNAITAGPAKHAEVAILQACKVLAMGQTQHAGGQGLLHGLVFLAPYFEGKSYEEIKQLCQMMIYELNQMYISRGGQVIFSSINISPGVPKVLEDVRAVRGGQILDKTYAEFEREVRLAFKAFMEISLCGDYTGKMFPFPKLEVAIENKFIDEDTWKNTLEWFDESEAERILDDYLENHLMDGIPQETRLNIIATKFELFESVPSYYELYKLAFEVVAKFGTLYFDNLLPESKKADSSMSCTQCCAYSFADNQDVDQFFDKKLHFEDGYHFKLGGMQVVSINLPRIAYKAECNDKLLWKYLYDVMDKAAEIFLIKKKMIEANKSRLRFLFQVPQKDGKVGQPYIDIDDLVYEIGIVGLNEAVQYHTGYQLHEDNISIDVSKAILSKMSEYCKILSQMHKIKIVLARTPAETVAQKFAVCDLIDENFTYKAINMVKGDFETALDMIKSDERNIPVYYSNGFAPSVDADINILYRVNIESKLWPYVDGGAITHVWLGEEKPDPEGLMDFAMRVFKYTNIGYLAFTKDFTQCDSCGNLMSGLVECCDKCRCKDVTFYSRITGYYSVVGGIKDGKRYDRWNQAKVEELKNRRKIDI